MKKFLMLLPFVFLLVAAGPNPGFIHTWTGISVKEAPFGAKGNGIADDTAAIQACLNSVNPNNGQEIVVPPGTYLISQPLTVAFNGTILKGLGGDDTNAVIFRWTGTSGGGPIYKIPNGMYGCGVEHIRFDGNMLAGICLHVETLAGSSTHHPYISHLSFCGYQTYGLILGQNDSVNLQNGQFQIMQADDLKWEGAAVTTAIGVLVNAQNAEFIDATNWYFDPNPAVYQNEAYHIYHRAGNLNIKSLATTRSNLYPIFAQDSFSINGWRAEEQFLITTATAQFSSPSVLTAVWQRPFTGGAGSDQAIQWNAASSILELNGCDLQSSIYMGPSNARYLVANGVVFELSGAGFLFGGPTQNQYGHYEDILNEGVTLRGNLPSIKGMGPAGAVSWVVGNNPWFSGSVTAVSYYLNNGQSTPTPVPLYQQGVTSFTNCTTPVVIPDTNCSSTSTVSVVQTTASGSVTNVWSYGIHAATGVTLIGTNTGAATIAYTIFN